MVDSLQDPDGAAATTWDRFGKPYINVWRGLAVVALWPLFLGYLCFAAAQKSVRSCRGTEKDSEGLILTKEARKNVEHVKKWNWTPVLRWAAVWGIALVALSVSGADDRPVYEREPRQSRGLLDAPGARRYWARATQ